MNIFVFNININYNITQINLRNKYLHVIINIFKYTYPEHNQICFFIRAKFYNLHKLHISKLFYYIPVHVLSPTNILNSENKENVKSKKNKKKKLSPQINGATQKTKYMCLYFCYICIIHRVSTSIITTTIINPIIIIIINIFATSI